MVFRLQKQVDEVNYSVGVEGLADETVVQHSSGSSRVGAKHQTQHPEMSQMFLSPRWG